MHFIKQNTNIFAHRSAATLSAYSIIVCPKAAVWFTSGEAKQKGTNIGRKPS